MASQVLVSLFPLTRVCLFPATTKPLNIFEPRYVQMINDALAVNGDVAVVYAEPTTTAEGVRAGVRGHLRAIAGVGKVRLLERRADAGMLILLEGTGKVRLSEVYEPVSPKLYLQAKGEWVKEEVELPPSDLLVLQHMMRELNRWLSIQVTDAATRAAFLNELRTAEQKVNAMCALMVLDADEQQSLLELNSISERLAQLALVCGSSASWGNEPRPRHFGTSEDDDGSGGRGPAGSDETH